VSPFIQGLTIAGIGMGLVFIAILALWGLMILLVYILKDKPKQEEVTPEIVETIQTAAIAETSTDKTRLQQVAAAAVAIALSMGQRSSQVDPQETGTISPWQATRRTSILGQSAALNNRKNRGNVR
jgi:Na+-transporting methylmalonyl-CoA/oxaloacetate decarboxylase gamma subunit